MLRSCSGVDSYAEPERVLGDAGAPEICSVCTLKVLLLHALWITAALEYTVSRRKNSNIFWRLGMGLTPPKTAPPIIPKTQNDTMSECAPPAVKIRAAPMNRFLLRCMQCRRGLAMRILSVCHTHEL